MTRFLAISLPLALALAAAATAAVADELDVCAVKHEACVLDCKLEHKVSDLTLSAAGAACGSVCAGKRAACETGEAYDSAKPWVEEKADQAGELLQEGADKAKRMWKDMMESEPEPEPAPEPAPAPKTAPAPGDDTTKI